jgi:hypothetical protein
VLNGSSNQDVNDYTMKLNDLLTIPNPAKEGFNQTPVSFKLYDLYLHSTSSFTIPVNSKTLLLSFPRAGDYDIKISTTKYSDIQITLLETIQVPVSTLITTYTSIFTFFFTLSPY